MIYTSIIGETDAPRTDVKCFTDPVWFASHRMASRQYKMLSHLWFNDEITVWMDANITLTVSEECLIKGFLPGDTEVACFSHPYRKNVLEEAKTVRLDKKEKAHRIDAFLEWLGTDRASNYNLFETGVLIRRKTERTQRLNEIWWSLSTRWTQRDQLTFPLAVMDSKVSINGVAGDVRNHPWFKYVPHAK